VIALSHYKSTGSPTPVLLDPSGLWTGHDPLESLRQYGPKGLETAFLFSEHGWIASFVWPDWPPKRSQEMREVVEAFHRDHSELVPITEDSDAWRALNRGVRSDPTSAERVAECFGRHFPGQVDWTRSEKNTRGTIEAKCSIQGLGVASINLSWRSFKAYPPGPDNNYQEMQAYQEAVKEVFAWARRRIQSILDTLQDKLKALYGERFRGLYVFGSYARPDAGIELPVSSDLDLALILSDFESPFEERERYGDLVADLSLEHSLVISVVPIREADFRGGTTNFTRVISEYAIPVR
jgi:uncharacterized protein